MNKPLNKESIIENLNTNVVGKDIIILDEVQSTNTYLMDLAEQGAKEGTVVISTNQTQGKGRLGRAWIGEKNKTLAISILLKPKNILINDCSITPLAGLALAKAINKICLADCKIKWPNDIIINNKKLCGILTEIGFADNQLSHTVTGMGINVSNVLFPKEIEFKATSILKETGRHIDPNLLIASTLNHFEKYVLGYNYSLTGEAIVEYRSLCATIGRQVIFNRGNRDVSGMAVAVNTNGELAVMLSDGTVVDVNCGDVTVQGIY